VEIALLEREELAPVTGVAVPTMNGDWTTKNAWFAPPMRAAHATTAGEAPTTSKATTPTAEIAVARTSTRRRPIRSESMLAGKATIAPAADPAVATRPMIASSKWREREVQVEVDPPEAERDAIDQRGEQEGCGRHARSP